MRLRVFAPVLLSLSLAGSTAWADSLFTLSGDLTNGGTFLGTLSVSAGGNASVQGTYTNGSYTFTLPANYLGEQLGEGSFQLVDVFPLRPPLFDLSLYIPDATLVGYTGGKLCTIDNNVCAPGVYSHYEDPATPETFFLDLAATPATTPEPASLGLLGTGLLALTATVRKRRQP